MGSICGKQQSLKVQVVFGRISMRFQAEGIVVRESSFKVRFLWESATCPSDDDVGSVVCRLHTLIKWFLLNKTRQETCSTRGKR